jgi:hypothetical protein
MALPSYARTASSIDGKGGLAIEDPRLSPVSPAIKAALKGDRNASSCKLIGMPILPSVSDTLPTYLVTTDDACNWGAAQGPIWVVTVSGDTAKVVLSAGGYSVMSTNATSNGYRNLIVGGGTAGEGVANEYVFNGKAYAKKKQ